MSPSSSSLPFSISSVKDKRELPLIFLFLRFCNWSSSSLEHTKRKPKVTKLDHNQPHKLEQIAKIGHAKKFNNPKFPTSALTLVVASEVSPSLPLRICCEYSPSEAHNSNIIIHRARIKHWPGMDELITELLTFSTYCSLVTNPIVSFLNAVSRI